jgi:histidine kinase
VDRVIREVIDLLSVQLTMMDIDLEYRLDASNALVLAQPTRLTQVLINLILNARDAIEARRKIEGAIAGTISIRAYKAGEFLKISVDDNGTGISADQINLLFEPFYTTKAPDKGTGLGLSVSYGIIADLGGTIRAESLPLGARFIVSLPNHPG